MNQLSWALLAGVVIITAVQLLTYYYLMRGRRDRSALPSSTGEGAGNRTPRAAARDLGDESADLSTREDVVQCSQCGSLNERDQMFSYCRNCAEELS